MNDKKIIEKLKELIKEGNTLAEVLNNGKSYNLEHNKKYYQRAKKWKISAFNILKIRFTEDSSYFQDFLSALNFKYPDSGEFFKENLSLSTGVLEAIYDALENGLTEDLFYQKEILIFSDLLEQAYEFLDKGLREATAIYGRIVLEITIKEFASKNNVEEKSFDQIIIKLRQNGIIHQPLENSLRANYKIGSDATHNNKEFQKYSDNEIKEYLNFIRDKVLTLK